MSKNSGSIRRIAQHVDIAKVRLTEKAKSGDPDALREILKALSAFLRGEEELEPCFASYLSQALETLTDEPRMPLWSAAATEFKALDQSQVSIEERVTGLTPRLSEKTRKRLGTAFCRAFGLSKRPGKDAEYHFLLTPSSLWKVAELRLHGASMRRAIQIARSAYSIEISDRQIKEWILKAHWLKPGKPGRYGYYVGEHQRRLRLATRVQQRTLRGMAPDEAYQEVARLAVTELCSMPRATVYLEPKTVADAYRYAKSSGDPRWERVECLARRFASQNQPQATELRAANRTEVNADP